jgi:hypothetical protein
MEGYAANARPVVEILQEMIEHVREIVRSEILLVKLNVRENIATRKRAALSMIVGNILMLFGGVFVLLGLVYAISTVWPPWLAAIVVGVAAGVVGGVVFAVGLRNLKNPKST